MRAPRRLSCISRHVVAATPPLPEPRARAQSLLESRPAKLLSDTEVQEFIRSGWMSIGPEAIGLPSSHVRQIYEDGCAWHDGPRKPGIHAHDNLLSEMPGLQEVCRSPAVHGALQSLLGHGYMLTRMGGSTPSQQAPEVPSLLSKSLCSPTRVTVSPKGDLFTTGAGQTFHKDGFFPGGGHGLRYHRPEYLLFFYYPQDTDEYMGPTEILPQSQYDPACTRARLLAFKS